MSFDQSLLKNMRLGHDGVWGRIDQTDDQKDEIAMRDRIADRSYYDYFSAIAKSHSIPVMDREVRKLLSDVPYKAVILDLGGCWGCIGGS